MDPILTIDFSPDLKTFDSVAVQAETKEQEEVLCALAERFWATMKGAQ